jgi:hypothetical protein
VADHRILVPKVTTYSAVEELIRKHLHKTTTSHRPVLFDLSEMDWIGYFPASLIYAWIKYLKTKGKDITICNLPRTNRQPHKVLVESGIFDSLIRMDIKFDFEPPPKTTFAALSFADITRGVSIQDTLKESEILISRNIRPDPTQQKLLSTVLSTIGAEILENGFLHGNSDSVYFGAQAAKSSGQKNGKSQAGLVDVFDDGVPYLELVLGDCGPGLHHTLSNFVPRNYEPPYEMQSKLTDQERAILYAFEYASTSDEPGRQRRIDDLLENFTLDQDHVATGLYAALEAARAARAQLVVRSSTSVISFSFYRSMFRPQVLTKLNLGLKSLADFPGTHFLLRVPLLVTGIHRPTADNRFSPAALHPSPEIRAINPFADWDANRKPAQNILAIEKAADSYLGSGISNGLTLIHSGTSVLSTRERAILLRIFQERRRGTHVFLWVDDSIKEILPPANARATGNLILVGSLIENRFDALGDASDRPGWLVPVARDVFSLEGNTKRLAFHRYCELVQKCAATLLMHPSVRKTPGPYLIENHYYTDVFYQVSSALKTPANISLFAEWFCLIEDSELGLIVVGAASLIPLAEEIANKLQGSGSTRLAVVCWDPTAPPAEFVTKTLPHSGKAAAIITDVVCTTKQLKVMLRSLVGPVVVSISTLVDARVDEEPLLVRLANKQPTEYQLRHIHRDAIGPYYHIPPPTRDAGKGVDSVYVIDRKTNSPTQYTRVANRHHIDIIESFKTVLARSGALRSGHVEYVTRHYQYFVHFPTLFAALSEEIWNWILKEVKFHDEFLTGEQRRWHFCIHQRADDSLGWLADRCKLKFSDAVIQHVSMENLQAPPPPLVERQQDLVVVCITPGIASGETCRQFAEYASRYQPKAILFLSLVSRLKAQDRTFFDGISQYQGAAFRFGVYWELSIRAYRPGLHTCPMCEEAAAVEHALASAGKLLPKDSPLVSLLYRKSRAHSAKIFDMSSPPHPALVNVEEEVELVYLRDLYEASDTEISARRKLNDLMLADKRMIDVFMQGLAAERRSSIYSHEEMQRRLYRVWTLVQDRVTEILTRGLPTPPCGGLASLLPALVHLNEANVFSRFESIALQSERSKADFEALVVEIAVHESLPLGVDALIDRYRKGGEKTSLYLDLLLDLKKLCIAHQNARMRDYDKSLESIGRLWANFARSSAFSHEMARLELATKDSDKDGYARALAEVDLAWQNDVSSTLADMMRSRAWQRVVARDRTLHTNLLRLEEGIMSLRSRGVDDKSTASMVEEAQKLTVCIAESIRSFFVNPMYIISEIPKSLLTTDGNTVLVAFEVQTTDPRVFCDREELRRIVQGEIVTNWQNHNGGASGQATIRVWESGDFINMDFSDDLPGRFDIRSPGGLRVVDDFAHSYSGHVQYEHDKDQCGQKTLRVALRAIREVIGGEK